MRNLDPSKEKKNYVYWNGHRIGQLKYSDTLLVLLTNKCFRYCEHCFRKRIHRKNTEVCKNYKALREFLKEHTKVNNVLLSGGDPLTLSNKKLEEIIMKYIPSRVDIRIGTRALTFAPNRFDKSLISLLRAYKISLQLHINKPYEYDSSVVEKLRSEGIRMFSQTVLLRGINDNPNILRELFRTLVKDGIQIYYIFQCRPVVVKYSVPIYNGIKILEEAKKGLTGHERTVRYIMSNSQGKVEIVGIYKNHFIFKYHRHRNPKKEGKIYLVPVDKKMIWWDEKN